MLAAPAASRSALPLLLVGLRSRRRRVEAAAAGRPQGRFRQGRSADLRGRLLLVPRREEAAVGLPARPQGRRAEGRRDRQGDRAGQECREPAHPLRRRARQGPEDAAEGGPADGRAGRRPAGLDRPGGRLAGERRRGRPAEALGVQAAGQAAAADGERPEVGPHADRRVHPGPAGQGRAEAVAGGRPDHAPAPAAPRPDRPAADRRRGRCVPGRQVAGRLRRRPSSGC